MTVDDALAIAFVVAGRSSQEIVSEAVGVAPSVFSKWKTGTRPTGKNRQKLLEWAESQPVPPVVDVLVTDEQRASNNIVRLSEISGYAKHVLAMMRAVTEQQAEVVQSLAPWVLRQERAEMTEADYKAATQRAANAALSPPTAPQSPRPETGAAGPRTASPPDSPLPVPRLPPHRVSSGSASGAPAKS